jgi:hypothetical protein
MSSIIERFNQAILETNSLGVITSAEYAVLTAELTDGAYAETFSPFTKVEILNFGRYQGQGFGVDNS